MFNDISVSYFFFWTRYDYKFSPFTSFFTVNIVVEDASLRTSDDEINGRLFLLHPYEQRPKPCVVWTSISWIVVFYCYSKTTPKLFRRNFVLCEQAELHEIVVTCSGSP